MVWIIIIICQTAKPTSKANSYKPKAISRESNPVRKGRNTRRQTNTIKNILAMIKLKLYIKIYIHTQQEQYKIYISDA